MISTRLPLRVGVHNRSALRTQARVADPVDIYLEVAYCAGAHALEEMRLLDGDMLDAFAPRAEEMAVRALRGRVYRALAATVRVQPPSFRLVFEVAIDRCDAYLVGDHLVQLRRGEKCALRFDRASHRLLLLRRSRYAPHY